MTNIAQQLGPGASRNCWIPHGMSSALQLPSPILIQQEYKHHLPLNEGTPKLAASLWFTRKENTSIPPTNMAPVRVAWIPNLSPEPGAARARIPCRDQDSSCNARCQRTVRAHALLSPMATQGERPPLEWLVESESLSCTNKQPLFSSCTT